MYDTGRALKECPCLIPNERNTAFDQPAIGDAQINSYTYNNAQ
jgi:hypothetical protein